MEEVIKEGKWKCPNCSTLNRGRDVKCSACGQARENVEFIYDESAPEVTDAAELADANSGPDWVCGFCATSNRAVIEKCRQCGAARGEGKSREVTDVKQGGSASEGAADSGTKDPVAASLADQAKPASGSGWLGWTILGLVVLFFTLALWTSEQQLTLTRAHWERVIPIEKQVPFVEEGWTVPTGGRVLSSRTDIFGYNQVQTGSRQVQETYTEKVQSGTKKVKVGVKNLGNGRFKELYENRPVYTERQRRRTVSKPVYTPVPIFKTKYRFEIHRWQVGREVRTAGDDTLPMWGVVQLAAGEREGSRKESYKLHFTGAKGKTYDMEPKEQLFTRLKTGSAYKGKITGLGALSEIVLP